MPKNKPSWPDSNKPGVPLNPERTMWHWLENLPPYGPYNKQGPQLRMWWGGSLDFRGRWDVNGASCPDTPEYQASKARYLGPCLIPSEVAAERAASWIAGRDKAVAECVSVRDGSHPSWDDQQPHDRGEEPATDGDMIDRLPGLIAALTPPSTSALDALIASKVAEATAPLLEALEDIASGPSVDVVMRGLWETGCEMMSEVAEKAVQNHNERHKNGP